MPEARRLRVAIVGAGLMGQWHADAARRANAVITLIADSNLERAKMLARKFGAKATARLDELFTTGAAELVHVCTPSEDHDALVRAAISSGIHAIVEKPLAATAADTAQLYSLAASRGVLLCPVHQFLFQSGMMRLLESRQTMGTVRQITSVICTAGADLKDDADRDRLAFDILPHPLSLAGSTLPRGLAGARWHTTRSGPGEIQAVAAVDGAAVAILISTRGRPTRNSFRVTGDRATWHADLFHGFAFREEGTVSRMSKLARPFAVAGRTLAAATDNAARRAMNAEVAFPGLRELVSRFYSAVSSGGTPPITVSDALDVAAARDTIIASLRLDGAQD
jgi:predicted dehydrogenase